MNRAVKLALISPRGGFFRNDGKFREEWRGLSNHAIHRNFWSGLSTGLLVIAALTPRNFKIKLIDENFEKVDFSEDFDLVGITGMTQQATRAYNIADVFRKKGVKVVMGGIHATVMPDEAQQHADSVFIGEAERLWPKFIEDYLKGDIKSFYKSPSLVDITKSPIPRYDLLDKKNYSVVWVQATRGCPIDCEFCAASKVYGYKFRHKEVEQVLDEIQYIIKQCGRRVLISFADDNMFVDKKYAVRLVEKLADLNVRWLAQADISVCEDERFLELLRKSGCSYLFIGFETLSRQGLNSLDRNNWKMRHFIDYKEVIEKIQSRGIGVLGAFILGLDTDTIDTFRETADFINESHLYAAQLTILTPLPGTRLRERLEREDRILSKDWNDYTFLKATFKPRNMSSQQLEEGLMKAYGWFYNSERNKERIRYFKEIYKNLSLKS